VDFSRNDPEVNNAFIDSGLHISIRS
jgi:hypothetical protein